MHAFRCAARQLQRLIINDGVHRKTLERKNTKLLQQGAKLTMVDSFAQSHRRREAVDRAAKVHREEDCTR